MEIYKNLGGNSNIKGYDIEDEKIVVYFNKKNDGTDTYVYDYNSGGKEHIEMMKKLAKEGRGLNSYINKNKIGYSKTTYVKK